MKVISTTLNTGDKINYSGMAAIVGEYQNGLIAIHIKLSETAGITQKISTKKANQLIKKGEIKL